MPAATSISELAKVLGTPRAPIIVDVRRAEAFKTAEHLLAGPTCRSAQRVPHWRAGRHRRAPLVVDWAHGPEASQCLSPAWDAAGTRGSYLAGGFGAWETQNLPFRRKRAEEGEGPSQWVTRERPKIDRIACPWLIRRFIDPIATFIYVPADRVLATAQETGATPYDVAGVEFTHEGDRCSFDTFLRIYGIADPALDHLAAIVRGADTSRHDLTPQCGGLFAVSLGLSANFPNDHEMLEHGM